ncbi:unnamed protein product [Arabis nemorensis]|uniref:Uncharacterized protein n=1 Tax=Arabis nemorensis TaxID=586526 RepID=A0A565BWZ2_9BRAS|nr:unnamed protein product [Arabis nemorensis]
MEEIMSMIFNGINLVKQLEFSLSSQESPESLSNSLGLVSILFGNANEQLKILLARRNSLVQNQHEPELNPMSGLDHMMAHTIEPGLMHDYWSRHAVMQTFATMDSGASSHSSTPNHRRR